LGIEKRIISPTFVILRTYALEEKNFFHVDLYRLAGTQHELEEIGLLDLLKNPKNIIAIEWSEKMKDFVPGKRWEIHFEAIDENRRRVTVKQI